MNSTHCKLELIRFVIVNYNLFQGSVKEKHGTSLSKVIPSVPSIKLVKTLTVYGRSHEMGYTFFKKLSEKVNKKSFLNFRAINQWLKVS